MEFTTKEKTASLEGLPLPLAVFLRLAQLACAALKGPLLPRTLDRAFGRSGGGTGVPSLLRLAYPHITAEARQDMSNVADGAAAGSVESAALAAQNLAERALMASGHERPEEDRCPICFDLIEFPVGKHSSMNVCCMKTVCSGCELAAMQRGMNDRCPFCRTPFTDDEASLLEMVRKRVGKGDAEAMKYRSNCGPRLQSWDQLMHITISASGTTLAMASKKTNRWEFATINRPQ